MKTMKIALSIVAISAIVTIYSIGAFVPQTSNIEGTFAGFLIISDAEMEQHVGGPDEGIRRLRNTPTDHDEASCGSSNPDCNLDRQVRDAYMYACDNCPTPPEGFTKYSYHLVDAYGNYIYDAKGKKIKSKQGPRILTYCTRIGNTCHKKEKDFGWDFDKNKGMPKREQTCNVEVGSCDDDES